MGAVLAADAGLLVDYNQKSVQNFTNVSVLHYKMVIVIIFCPLYWLISLKYEIDAALELEILSLTYNNQILCVFISEHHKAPEVYVVVFIYYPKNPETCSTLSLFDYLSRSLFQIVQII